MRVMAWKNGFQTPTDKIYGAKVCKGATPDNNNSDIFYVGWSWTYRKEIDYSRKRYPRSWACTYGQWCMAYAVPARTALTNKWWGVWKNYDNKGCERQLKRSEWYPVTGYKLKKVGMKVQGHNDAGYGPVAYCPEYAFARPTLPTIDGISYNSETGDVSTKIKFTRNTRVWADTYDLRYRRVVDYNFKVDPKTGKKKWAQDVTSWTTTQNAETSVSYAPGWAKHLEQTDIARVTWQCFTRGLAGDSCNDLNSGKFLGYTSKMFVYAWPAKPTLFNVKIAGDMLIVGVNTQQANNNHLNHPVDTVKLQYCNDTTYTNAGLLGGATWHDVDGMVDNANCQGFATPYQNLKPAAGNQLWVRVEAKHCDYVVHSTPWRVAAAYTSPPAEATAADDKCVILSSSSVTDDGKGIKLLVACKNDGNTGTEVSWSTYANAWNSTEKPTTFEADWALGNNTDNSTKNTYPKLHTIYIRGLEEGQLYYVKARRYLEGNTKTFSAYASKNFTPESTPDGVFLVSPTSISVGQDLAITWTYDSEREQTQYSVFDPSVANKRVWVSGKDAKGYAVIPWSVIDSRAVYVETGLYDSEGNLILDSSGNQITLDQPPSVPRIFNLAVKMTTGGGWATSNSVAVHINYTPSCDITIVPDGTYFERNAIGAIVMKKQGGLIKLNTSSKEASANVAILSVGSVKTYPDMSNEYQVDGDVVWGDVYSSQVVDGVGSPTSSEDTDALPVDEFGTLTCRLPSDITLVDGGKYTIVASITDSNTGLSSDTISVDFSVDWSHKAVAPETTIETNPIDFTATIGVWKPENAAITDVVDIYRVTPDGVHLVASDVEWGSFVLDKYAPFSNGWGERLMYRLSTRTLDGDEVWEDFEYSLYGYSIRFDWKTESTLSLPYNLKISDNWTKGFEARKHLDGTFSGYFDGSVQRDSSFSTDMVKVTSDEDKRLVRSLANHTGPVFVRTPTGSAFVGNVTPKNLTYEYNNPIVSVSFDVTEFKLTDEFTVQEGDITPSGYSTLSAYLASQST